MVTVMLAIESWNVRWNDGLDRVDQTIHGGHAIPLPFETVAPFNYFTSTGICRASISIISYTRDTRNCGSFFSFFLLFSLSLSLFLSPSTIYVFIRSMATLRHRGRIDICTTNRTRGRYEEAFHK